MTTRDISRRTTILSLMAIALANPGCALKAPPEGSAETRPLECTAPPTDERPRKVPQTVEDHLALVERYRCKAAEHHKEADEHRKMLAGYRSDMATIPNKMGREFPWFTKLREHCEGYIRRADALASEAERFAEFHRMRAKELQGE